MSASTKDPGAVAVGERIQRARLALGLTADDLAHRIESVASSVHHWERGGKLPSDAKLSQLARELKVSEEFLRNGTPGPAQEYPERDTLVASPEFRAAPEPVRHYILHLDPARKISLGKWHQFFETALELYSLGVLPHPSKDPVPEAAAPAVRVARPLSKRDSSKHR